AAPVGGRPTRPVFAAPGREDHRMIRTPLLMSFVVSFASLVQARVSGSLARLSRLGRSPAADFSAVAASLYLAVFVPVIGFAILRNSEWNNHSPDTMFHPSTYDMLAQFSSIFSN